MIIDIHTHICPPEMVANRDKFLRPGETAFAAIYKDPRARLVEMEDLLRVMDEDGVDMAVTFGFPWVTEDTAKRHNDYILEAQTRFPDRLIGLACFHPLQSWAEREARRTIEAGLKGLGELAVYEADFDWNALDRMAGLANICRESNLPLLVHVNEPIGHQYLGKAPLTLKMIHELVKATQGVKLILAHWGGGLFFYGLLKKEVPGTLADVYFDTAASPFLYRPRIYKVAADIVGPEKILFGSDFPLIAPGRCFREMEAAGLGDHESRLIKGGAAEQLFGLSTAEPV